jgi:hypothetical protein
MSNKEVKAAVDHVHHLAPYVRSSLEALSGLNADQVSKKLFNISRSIDHEVGELHKIKSHLGTPDMAPAQAAASEAKKKFAQLSKLLRECHEKGQTNFLSEVEQSLNEGEKSVEKLAGIIRHKEELHEAHARPVAVKYKPKKKEAEEAKEAKG